MSRDPASRRNVFDRLRPIRRLAGPIETAQVRWAGRSLVSVAIGAPVLALHSRGRRSGRIRSTTLAFHGMEDGSLVVVGGAGGQTRVPDWVANLRADATASVTVRRARVEVEAIELTGADRDEMWALLREIWPKIDAYERRAGRDVPVFRLIPRQT